ncbi:hypothetical protein QVD17_36086 [Tagetes erecta]|uniref:Uncharacterized protein n=1 Tax=Tagetes erecta TaxID=13708 RepID=A0AAD8NBM5_TARER|nr:hypothetical protein QVD17_36086 [Tagetes erecta]
MPKTSKLLKEINDLQQKILVVFDEALSDKMLLEDKYTKLNQNGEHGMIEKALPTAAPATNGDASKTANNGGTSKVLPSLDGVERITNEMKLKLMELERALDKAAAGMSNKD